MSMGQVSSEEIEEAWTKVVVRLRAARISAKLSQQKLADRAGVTKAFISQVESKNVNPSVVTIIRLAKGIGISACELFED